MDAPKKYDILIVDDESSNIVTLTSILGSEYHVRVADNGRDAINTAKKYLPDLILLDVVMPSMDGYAVITELKNSSDTKDIPVIFITGRSDVDDEEKGLTLGAADYITKPFSPKNVLLRVKYQLKMLEQHVTIMDITAKMQVEEANRKAIISEESDKAKSRFLANMSHEIRTPMNAILGITEILLQNETLPDNIAEGLSKIYASCDLLLGIINDILDFSKIEAGKLDIIPAEYNVASLINDSVQLNVLRIGDKPIEFELIVDENIPSCLIGDEIRLKQILNNLLSNAFKYTESGKVTFSVTAKSLPSNDGQTVELIITVSDTGVGMSEEQIEILFDEYSRFNEESKNRTIEGTGLGLAITKNLLLLMGSDIDVKSEPNKGSTFTVKIPQKVANPQKLGKETVESLQKFRLNECEKKVKIIREPLPYGSVLIVDDVQTNIYVAVGLMKLYGLKIDTALSGAEAIKKVESGNVYDIILMDYMMPIMNGIETMKRLRELGYTKPIVALTADALAGQAEKFLQSGFDAFLSKPIDMRQLDSLLIKMIRNKYSPKVEALNCASVNACDADNTLDKITLLMLDAKIDGIDIESGIKRNGNDGGAFLKVLRKYVAGYLSLFNSLSNVNENDIHDYTIAVHSIKGTSYEIFADNIGKMAAKLEEAAKSGDYEYITQHNPILIDSTQKLVGDLQALFSAAEAADPKPLKDKPDEQLLKELRAACESYSMFDVDAVMDEIDCYRYSNDDGLVDWIRDKVDMVKFPEIAKKLEKYQ